MNIAIAGYKGRVGQLLVKELESGDWPELSFSGGTLSSDNPETLFDDADLVIDFTTPEATRKHVWLAAKHHTSIIIGTTGLNDGDMKEMQNAAAETALLYSANMSVGINLLAALVEQASARLGTGFDIGISETHHRHKRDAPSGTALMLGRAASSPDIAYAVQRGGDVIGEHTVSFFGPGERLELTHRAHDRSLYAKGALRAALWLKEKPHGFYTMRDVLDLA